MLSRQLPFLLLLLVLPLLCKFEEEAGRAKRVKPDKDDSDLTDAEQYENWRRRRGVKSSGSEDLKEDGYRKLVFLDSLREVR